MEDQEIAHKIADLSPEEQQQYRCRHSLAHILAQAVLDYFGKEKVKLGIGPPIEHGFYYDFDLEEKLEEEDLAEIEKRMKEIIKAKQKFSRIDNSCEEAEQRLQALQQPYKLELLRDLKAKGASSISFYENGPFMDMCEGPHLETTKEVPKGSFKLDRIAGAYWRGSEKNKMLTRIYGLSFSSAEELKNYLERRTLALERDHRKLNKEQEYFVIEEEVGKGLPLWLPNGTVLREELEKLAREVEFRAGYKRVATPHITKQKLYEISGHLEHYKDSMFPPMKLSEEEGEEAFYLKPMNCPHHHLIFRTRPRSYRELPLRLAEYGQVYRYEQSGELAGLLRVRGMCMNDAHIYCTEEQLRQEFKIVMEMHAYYYQLFGLKDYYMRLSLPDLNKKDSSKYIADIEMWRKAERYIQEAMQEVQMPYRSEIGEAAFYGPKIDVQFKNVFGREETASTNQVDFVMAKRFQLYYHGEDGELHHPVILHRAPLGTHERFISF